MSSVDFFTFCCDKDVDKLHLHLKHHVKSHQYDFNKVGVIHQRTDCPDPDYDDPIVIEKEDYPIILARNGINPVNDEADSYTHGWNAPHYWKHHCVNHLVAMEHGEARFIVLSDADCYIKSGTWIEEGIKVLTENPDVLVVSPGDGGSKFDVKTQTMSQQLFLCERQRLQRINFDLPFEGFTEGGPFQEYYFMLEGRIGRYMEKNSLYRYIINSSRYWHRQW